MQLTNHAPVPSLTMRAIQDTAMAYTKKWYEANKDKIGKTRRDRYHSDPDYRASVLEQSKAYREKRKAERAEFLANPYIEKDGQTVPAKTVDMVQAELGVDKARLKYLQKAGYLPSAIVSRPLRLYTYQQVDFIAQLESFLAKWSPFLRATRTEEGQHARTELDKLVTTIHQNWSI